MSTLRARRLVFTGLRRCEVQAFDFDPQQLGPEQATLETELSIMSTGTELAGYTALEPGVLQPGAHWQSYPWTPGYGAVCRVLAAGAHSGLIPGQRVLAIAPHASHAVIDAVRRPPLAVCSDDRAEDVVLLRMAAVAMTALRLSRLVHVGARVAVIGLGLVGNFAAQLFARAGCEVVAFDLAPRRVELARSLHIPAHVADGARAVTIVAEHWPTQADIAIEAIGNPDLVMSAAAMVRPRGEVVLLGSPRGPFRGEAGALLSTVHMRGLTLTGALEWMVPFRDADAGDLPSIQAGYRTLLTWLRDGSLLVDGLLSSTAAPDRAQEIYMAIERDRNAYLGVAFDWRAAGA